MILYHTSTIEITRPDVSHSRLELDFGKGFYLTTLVEQAKRYGKRFISQGLPAIMNVYQLDEDCGNCSRKMFNVYDGEWLDFVMNCRRNLAHPQYDIIKGGIANDKIFNTVDLYFAGIYTREQALDKLQYEQPNHQICITSQEVLDQHVHFVKSIKL